MLNLLNNLTGQAKLLLIAAITIVILISVIQVWARTRSLAPTIGVLILGGVVLWGVNSTDTIRQDVTNDMNDCRAAGAQAPTIGC